MDGGSDDPNNLAAACFHCNQHRGQQMNSSRQKLKRLHKPDNVMNVSRQKSEHPHKPDNAQLQFDF